MRKEIITMAFEAGLGPFEMNCALVHVEVLERFFHMAQAAEREACAKFFDNLAEKATSARDLVYLNQTAAAIRARGQA